MKFLFIISLLCSGLFVVSCSGEDEAQIEGLEVSFARNYSFLFPNTGQSCVDIAAAEGTSSLTEKYVNFGEVEISWSKTDSTLELVAITIEINNENLKSKIFKAGHDEDEIDALFAGNDETYNRGIITQAPSATTPTVVKSETCSLRFGGVEVNDDAPEQFTISALIKIIAIVTVLDKDGEPTDKQTPVRFTKTLQVKNEF